MKLKKIAIGLLVCVTMLAGCKAQSEMPPLDEGSSVTYSSASSSSSSVVSTTGGTSSASGNASQNSAQDPAQSTVQGTVKPAQSSAPHVHDYEIKEYVEPTCFRDGHSNYTCKCGDGYITVIEATGHKYSVKTIEPDCVNQGCTRYTCDVCGYSYEENFVSPLDHKYGAWKTVKEATTSSNGENQATCSRCGKTISQPIPPLQPAVTFDDFTSEVVRLVNIERANYGLSPLSESSKLGDFAQTRSQEIIDLFDHTRPNGNRAVKDVLALGGLRTCGENIAMGQPTPEAVVDAWMHSEGHRKNILTADFTMIGVGCSYGGGTYYWVQVFGG
ncbi:MAG: hypothetical protein K2J77_05000 [Oscillospiraceae bacterium]|nr:hypothetical protein [Oscillospiraceae bacterium]